MLSVGLTGGIACGKSVVAGVLAESGCRILEADAIAHTLMEPEGEVWAEIVALFGHDILHRDRTIDRERLGSLVFGNDSLRIQLNRIIHPRVFAEELRRLEKIEDSLPLGRGIAVVEAALMVEVGSYRRYDRLVVVHCPERVQLQRLIAERGMDRQTAEQRIGSQLAVTEKMALAHYTVDTSGSLEETRRLARALYRQLAADEAALAAGDDDE